MTNYSDAIDIITAATEAWFTARSWFQLAKDEDADEVINRELPRLVRCSDDEDYYDATPAEIEQAVVDGLERWAPEAINAAIEAALECAHESTESFFTPLCSRAAASMAADWFRDGCTEGPAMYREESGEMVQVVRRILAEIESERVAKEYADSPDAH